MFNKAQNTYKHFGISLENRKALFHSKSKTNKMKPNKPNKFGLNNRQITTQQEQRKLCVNVCLRAKMYATNFTL